MSNPAVITLAEVHTRLGVFSVEDNLGESIHLHIGEIRCDLTIEELENLAFAIEISLERFIKADGFKVKDYSKEFLLQLAERELLPYIESIDEDTIRLSDLKVDVMTPWGGERIESLTQSRVLKALMGDTKENDLRKERNYFNQTNQSRVEDMLNSIKVNGYPYNNQKIVLFSGNNKIYDGQHRAACMYYLWGDKEIQIKRIGFSTNSYEKKKNLMRTPYLKIKHGLKRAIKYLFTYKNKIINYINRRKNNFYYRWDKFHYKKI